MPETSKQLQSTKINTSTPTGTSDLTSSSPKINLLTLSSSSTQITSTCLPKVSRIYFNPNMLPIASASGFLWQAIPIIEPECVSCLNLSNSIIIFL